MTDFFLLKIKNQIPVSGNKLCGKNKRFPGRFLKIEISAKLKA